MNNADVAQIVGNMGGAAQSTRTRASPDMPTGVGKVGGANPSISVPITRRAKPQDLDGMTALAILALEQTGYEHMVISPRQIRAHLTLAISGAGNYAEVVIRDGVVVAAVAALVHDCMCYERRQATVIQFYTTEPGAGVRLIRRFLTWARERPIIKMIVFTLEVKADPRIGKLLSRMGLKAEMPVYMEIR